MGKYCASLGVLKGPWDQVFAAFWQRYPNPYRCVGACPPPHPPGPSRGPPPSFPFPGAHPAPSPQQTPRDGALPAASPFPVPAGPGPLLTPSRAFGVAAPHRPFPGGS